MKKLLRTLSLALFMGVTLLATSCDKKNNGNEPEPPVTGEVKKAEYIDASAYDKWAYFSFATGNEVKVSDPKNSKDWDVAFHRGDIRVNGAEGFSGKGGVFMTEGTDLNAKIDTKNINFKTNTEALVQVESGMIAKQENRPVKTEKQHYIFVGEKTNEYRLFAYNPNSQMGDVKNMYPANKKIFVFRGADGKSIYKVQLADVLDAKGRKAGFLSFNYAKI